MPKHLNNKSQYIFPGITILFFAHLNSIDIGKTAESTELGCKGILGLI